MNSRYINKKRVENFKEFLLGKDLCKNGFLITTFGNEWNVILSPQKFEFEL